MRHFYPVATTFVGIAFIKERVSQNIRFHFRVFTIISFNYFCRATMVFSHLLFFTVPGII
jgi:hypothetical protein